MTNRTISELPNFTGDTSMRLHVHKPGSSESLSLNDIGNLVTTGEGLQTGDVVLRPAGTYADALECNGGIHVTSSAPILASKLANPALGVMPVSINANSETRFHNVISQRVRKLGNLIVTSESGYFRLFKDNVLVSSVATSLVESFRKVYKSKKALYFTTGTGGKLICKFNSSGYMSTAAPDSASNPLIVGVCSYDLVDDLICYSQTGTVIFALANPNSGFTLSTIQTFSSVDYTINSVRNVNGRIFAAGTILGISGVYKLNFSNGSIAFELVKPGSYSEICEGNSSYIYVRSNRITKIHPDTYQEYEVSTVNVAGFRDFSDSLYMYPWSPFRISFDAGSTWISSPTMSGYQDFDYDQGIFVFVGGSGTTGSVNGQSGTIQTNSANFLSDSMFRVPLISSPVQYFKQYIIK